MNRDPERLIAEVRRYQSDGLPVHLIRPDKRPVMRWKAVGRLELTPRRFEDALRAFPHLGVAISTGVIADVVDVEQAGLTHIEDLEMPVTPCAKTQRGGLHIYVKSGKLRSTVWQDGDLRIADFQAAGKYVVAPPTLGVHGAYEWLPGRAWGEVPLAEPVAWMVERAGLGRGDTQATCRRGDGERRGGGQLVRTLTAAVPPPHQQPFVSPRRHVSNSEADQSEAYRMACEGASEEDILQMIFGGDAYARRGLWADNYADLTLAKAIALADERLVEAVIVNATLTRARVWIDLHLERRFDGTPRASLSLDWPPNEVSTPRWLALAAALGLDEIIDPQTLGNRRLSVEMTPQGGRHRIGRLHPSRSSLRSEDV